MGAGERLFSHFIIRSSALIFSRHKNGHHDKTARIALNTTSVCNVWPEEITEEGRSWRQHEIHHSKRRVRGKRAKKKATNARDVCLSSKSRRGRITTSLPPQIVIQSTIGQMSEGEEDSFRGICNKGNNNKARNIKQTLTQKTRHNVPPKAVSHRTIYTKGEGLILPALLTQAQRRRKQTHHQLSHLPPGGAGGGG